jgi:hypothetical protein
MAENKKDIKRPLTEETSSQRILLEEYRLIENRYLRIRNEAVIRMNFFITSASVALGGVLVFASGNNMPFIYFRLVLLVALIVLSAIGLDIFFFLIGRDIESDRYERGLARIRQYFVKLDPAIRDYFMNDIVDIPTRYIVRKLSGIRTALQIIECFLLGLGLTIAYTFLSIDTETLLLVGGIAAILIFIILELVARSMLAAAVKGAEKEIRFGS